MTRLDPMPMATRERAALHALLTELDAADWAAPSLCPGWSVRDVAVHAVSYDELSPLGLAGTFLRGGLRVDRVNEVALHRYDDLDHQGVLDLVARCERPRGLTTGFRGGIALTDGTIHHQDVRRALGRPRDIPADQLRAVLDFALFAPTLPARRNARGLRLAATDLDWSAGSGPVATGPGEALLMAVAGRAHALEDLAGDGVPTLRERVAG